MTLEEQNELISILHRTSFLLGRVWAFNSSLLSTVRFEGNFAKINAMETHKDLTDKINELFYDN